MSETATGPAVHAITHDFLHARYDAVNGCERQQQLRQLAPMPFGAVLIARDDMDEDTIRWHLRTMKELGFNSIKQFMGSQNWSRDRLEELALEEGLCPWWYGEGGWEPITDALCNQLGIDPALSMADKRAHPAMQEHQRGVWRSRLGRAKIKGGVEAQAGFGENKKTSVAGAYGTNSDLPEWAADEFRDWLRRYYDNDVDALNKAWNVDCHRAKSGTDDRYFRDFEAIAYKDMTHKRDYGRVCDVLRFKADLKARDVAATCKLVRERDPYEPHRAGGEMGLFLPFASRGTDMEGIARAMKETGSFYPSIHLCWHFEETDFEVARPVYMQASFVVDLNKGGWTAPWESTGGPQQTSGSNAPLFQWARDEQPGYTVDAGVMTQLIFSYLAAGCRGAGIWSWNARIAGVEGGEYALLDRNEQVCDRTRRVGAIAKAANDLRDELWSAHKEPQVGVLMDWDNEACWAAMSEFNRTVFKHYPIEARIGACRMLINNNVPFEYITQRDMAEGLAARYPIIYMPGILGLNPKHLSVLTDYVKQGGRVVLDMPGGGYDHRGRMLSTKAGSDFEQLFGVELADLQYSGNNVNWTIDHETIDGYVCDLNITSAEVIKQYGNGRPAVTENRLGSGTAVIVGWESGRRCYRPGADSWEQRAVQVVLGGQHSFIGAEGQPWVFRLAAADADHYFLLNEGDAAPLRFTHLPSAYRSVTDVLSGETVDLGAPIEVETAGGRWLRCVK